jgi:hypothetical protein
MSEANIDRITATRRIAAPAAVIFHLLATPQGHVDIDASGSLIAAPDAPPLTAVGDRFTIHMDRRPLGDIPDMAEYDVENVVTRIEPDVLLEWSPTSAGYKPIGHVFGYLITPVSDRVAEVTSYFDWSAVSEKWHARVNWPVVPATTLAKSLDKLADLCESD